MEVALYFGSFDPLHIGHTAIAGYLLDFRPIDALWFIVSPQNPHKQNRLLSNAKDRCRRIERYIAYASDPRMHLSTIELDLPTPSYTCVTLRALQARYPEVHFSILMGEDSLCALPAWREGEWIIDHFRLYVYPRAAGHFDCQWGDHPNVFRLDAPLLHISSTFVRQGWAEGRSMRHFLAPPLVEVYNGD